MEIPEKLAYLNNINNIDISGNLITKTPQLLMGLNDADYLNLNY